MDYVMVPVPQDSADELRLFLAQRAARDAARQAGSGASRQQTDPAGEEHSIARILDQVDDAARTLLITVARATVEGSEPAVSSSADAIGCNAREVVGMALEFNYLASELGGRPMAIMMPRGPAGPSGRVWDEQVLVMSEDIARLVLSADVASRSPRAPEGASG